MKAGVPELACSREPDRDVFRQSPSPPRPRPDYDVTSVREVYTYSVNPNRAKESNKALQENTASSRELSQLVFHKVKLLLGYILAVSLNLSLGMALRRFLRTTYHAMLAPSINSPYWAGSGTTGSLGLPPVPHALPFGPQSAWTMSGWVLWAWAVDRARRKAIKRRSM